MNEESEGINSADIGEEAAGTDDVDEELDTDVLVGFKRLIEPSNLPTGS